MVIAPTFQKHFRRITYKMDDLRTKVETDVLCVINGATTESSVGGATADDLKILRVEKLPNHTLVYPLRVRLCIVNSLYFCSSLSMTDYQSIERIT